MVRKWKIGGIGLPSCCQRLELREATPPTLQWAEAVQNPIQQTTHRHMVHKNLLEEGDMAGCLQSPASVHHNSLRCQNSFNYNHAQLPHFAMILSIMNPVEGGPLHHSNDPVNSKFHS